MSDFALCEWAGCCGAPGYSPGAALDSVCDSPSSGFLSCGRSGKFKIPVLHPMVGKYLLNLIAR